MGQAARSTRQPATPMAALKQQACGMDATTSVASPADLVQSERVQLLGETQASPAKQGRTS